MIANAATLSIRAESARASAQEYLATLSIFMDGKRREAYALCGRSDEATRDWHPEPPLTTESTYGVQRG